MSLGKALKLIRVSIGKNQKEMANHLRISQNYLSLIESGKKYPHPEKVNDIAKALCVSKEALLFIALDAPKELENDDKSLFFRLQSEVTMKIMWAKI